MEGIIDLRIESSDVEDAQSVKKLLSTGDIVQVKGFFKLPMEVLDTNENIENEKYTESDFTDSENNEDITDGDDKNEKADMIQSEETEFYKEIKKKIFNEDDYGDCPFKDCFLVVYGDYIHHLQDHELQNSEELTKWIGSERKDNKVFTCSECEVKYACFEYIANHIYSHFNEKAHEEKECDICGCKRRGLKTFKIHKCSNFKVNNRNNQKSSCNESIKIPASIDPDYKPPDDSDYSSSDSDMENSDDEIQNSKKAISSKKVLKIKKHNVMNEEINQETDNFTREEINQETGKKHYLCLECGRSFTNRLNCTDHRKKLHSTEKVCCVQCDYQCHDIGNLVEHMAKMHIKNDTLTKYNCDQCDYQCHGKRDLLNHIARMHMSDLSLQCKICNKFYKHPRSLGKHMSKIHPSNPENVTTSTCMNDKGLQCEICNKFYKNHRSLGEHMRKKHPSNPENAKSFTCMTCNKVFKHTGHFQRHMLIHSGEKPFACTVCNYRTNQKSNIDIHMKNHEKESSINKNEITV